jgi:hypothetical protein
VKHPYYEGTWTLFIDPESYAMRGFRVQNELFSDISCTYEGELEVGGVRMAQAKTCYQDDVYFATDIFSYVADR